MEDLEDNSSEASPPYGYFSDEDSCSGQCEGTRASGVEPVSLLRADGGEDGESGERAGSSGDSPNAPCSAAASSEG